MSTFTRGEKVTAGIRTGVIVSGPTRKWRQDVYLVQFPVRDAGDGYAPHYIPATQLTQQNPRPSA